MKHSMFMFINEAFDAREDVNSTKMPLTDKKICSNFCFEHGLKIFERKVISGGEGGPNKRCGLERFSKFNQRGDGN